MVIVHTAVDKQKRLLSADVGHFSLVRALHLADLITLLNGIDIKPSLFVRNQRGLWLTSYVRLLRNHVDFLFPAIRAWRPCIR